MKPATYKKGPMSRTYRRKNSYEEYWYSDHYFKRRADKTLAYYRAHYHSDSCHTMHQCPAWFKTILKKKYRHQCKMTLRNATAGNVDYDELIFPVFYKDALLNWW